MGCKISLLQPITLTVLIISAYKRQKLGSSLRHTPSLSRLEK